MAAAVDTELSMSSMERESIISVDDSIPEISNDSMESTATCSTRSFGKTRETSRLPDSVVNFDPEMMSAYKIVAQLMHTSNKHVNFPFLHPIDENLKENRKYYTVIQHPLWLNKVKTRLLQHEYSGISQVIRDLRLILENCYRYYGPAHPNTKKAMKLETMLEQKLALLPRDLKTKTTLELTSPDLVKLDKDNTLVSSAKNPQRASASSWKEPSSVILSCVRKARAQQEREQRRQHMEEKKAEKEASHIELLGWEENMFREELTLLKTMWEIPQIGHFLYLTQAILNIPEVSHFELERAFLMPASSSLLATIMTSLLSSPQQRSKLDKIPAMPYRIWQRRLNIRVQNWYRTYLLKERDLLKVFEVTGVEPEFFRIIGHENILETKKFHEVTLKQRVWLVKAVCDYCVQNHKSIQEGMFETHPLDQKEYYLGEDSDDNVFVHFPQFCGQSLRVYKQYIEERPMDIDLSLPPVIKVEDVKVEADAAVEVAETEKVEAEEEEEEEVKKKAPQKRRKGGRRRRAPRAPPKVEEPEPLREFSFNLVAESVEGLRQLMESYADWSSATLRSKNLDKGMNPRRAVPEKTLYNNIKNLIRELEPWEAKLELAEKKSRYKLKKEYDQCLKRTKDNTPEASENFWASDSEEEPVLITKSSSLNSSRVPSETEELDPSMLNASTSFRKSHYRRCTKRRCVDNTLMGGASTSSSDDDSDSSSTDSFQVTVSSRGRVRHTRNFSMSGMVNSQEKKHSKRNVSSQENALNIIKPNQRNMLESHRNQNSVTDAKMQYQWETMRQKLLNSEPQAFNAAAGSKPPVIPVPIIKTAAEEIVKDETDEIIEPGFGSMKTQTPVEETTSGNNFSAATGHTMTHLVTAVNAKPLHDKPLPPYQPKLPIGRKSQPGSRPTIFRQMVADGGRRVVQTTFSRPGVLRTTVSPNELPKIPAFAKNNIQGLSTATSVASQATNGDVEQKQIEQPSSTTVTPAVKPIQTPPTNHRKVLLIPYNGPGSTPGKTFVLKVVDSNGETLEAGTKIVTLNNNKLVPLNIPTSTAATTITSTAVSTATFQTQPRIAISTVTQAAPQLVVSTATPQTEPQLAPCTPTKIIQSPIRIQSPIAIRTQSSPQLRLQTNPIRAQSPQQSYSIRFQNNQTAVAVKSQVRIRGANPQVPIRIQATIPQAPIRIQASNPQTPITIQATNPQAPIRIQASNPQVIRTPVKMSVIRNPIYSPPPRPVTPLKLNPTPQLTQQQLQNPNEVIFPTQQPTAAEIISLNQQVMQQNLVMQQQNEQVEQQQFILNPMVTTSSLTVNHSVPIISHQQMATANSLISLSSPMLPHQQQQMGTVLTQCPVQLQQGAQTMQFVANQQLISTGDNQNMIVCSNTGAMLGNANGYIKTTNAWPQQAQGNLYVLTSTGQLVAVSGTTVDGTTIVTENMQTM